MNQKKKKFLLSLGMITGLVFQFAGIYSGAEHLRMISGICIGIGAVLFSLSLNKLYRLFYEKAFPDTIRREQIESKDERNLFIRNRAKSITSDISRWAVIGLAWINLLVNGFLWMTLALIGVFVMIYFLEWYYTDKYQREM